ncbi:MAG: hydrogenase, partial [Alphaproteobacteria bacterium]|nr:hydrogenase [Alphaproteobacteria bacterium]
GGWMVIVLLLVLSLQGLTGLFTDDDVATSGPLAGLASYDTVQRISTIHRLNFDLILILAGLHVAAVILYFTIARHDLIRPMFTGRKPRRPGMEPARFAGLPRALLLLAVSALAVWGLVSLG